MSRAARWVLACGLLAACGCGRDPVADSIRRLGGPPAEANRARMELKLTSRDPVPELKAAVLDRHARMRVRVVCLEILGDIARRSKEEAVFDFLIEMLGSDVPEMRETAVKGFVDTDCEKAVPALIALKKDADRDLLKLIDKALASTARHLAEEAEKLWNSPESALAEYERLGKIGLDRGWVGYSKAKFLEVRGRAEEAGDKFDEMGFVRRYWLAGPFPNRQGLGFRRVYPPEKEIDLEAEYTAGYGKVRWYEMDRNAPAALVNFENFFVETDNVVGYALIFLVSDRDRTVEIRAGSDDTLTLFLNGEMIWAHEQYRGVKFDDDVVDAELKKGVNTVLFKVCEDWGAWALIGRVTGPGDSPLEGVVITTRPGA